MKFKKIDEKDCLVTNHIVNDTLIIPVWTDGIYFMKDNSITETRGFDRKSPRFDSFQTFNRNILTANLVDNDCMRIQ